jgi:hypothetical protein
MYKSYCRFIVDFVFSTLLGLAGETLLQPDPDGTLVPYQAEFPGAEFHVQCDHFFPREGS